jgi:nucleoside-diphosphate kinase
MTERTLMIIKPDAVSRNAIGAVIKHVEEEGFRVVEMRMATLTYAQAAEFYAVHRERPFYGSLLEFMTSGPSVCAVLEREDAVSTLREVVGATDSAKAAPGTIRRAHGTKVQENAVHASDSAENGDREVAFFFGESALHRDGA